jgi:hypothetical protein
MWDNTDREQVIKDGDVLTETINGHEDSLNAFNALMQAFMAVRNKNTFIAFITFSDIYMC